MPTEGMSQNLGSEEIDFQSGRLESKKAPEGDKLVNSLKEAIDYVRANPNSTAAVMPIHEWDVVSLEMLDPTIGLYKFSVSGFPDFIGATTENKEKFLSRFKQAS